MIECPNGTNEHTIVFKPKVSAIKIGSFKPFWAKQMRFEKWLSSILFWIYNDDIYMYKFITWRIVERVILKLPLSRCCFFLSLSIIVHNHSQETFKLKYCMTHIWAWLILPKTLTWIKITLVIPIPKGMATTSICQSTTVLFMLQ